MQEFRSVTLSDESFTVHDGTPGTFSYEDVKKVSVLNEQDSFRGTEQPFLHQVLGGASAFVAMEPKLYVGLKVVLKNEDVIGIYVSQVPVLFNSDPFKKDQAEAKQIEAIFHKHLA